MRLLAASSIAILLAGCATTAPSQMYRGADHKGSAWEIAGEYNDFSKNVIIKVNGQNAIDGNLPVFGSGGEVYGTYAGKNVTANCSRVTKMFSSYMQCMVFVANERAATLQF